MLNHMKANNITATASHQHEGTTIKSRSRCQHIRRPLRIGVLEYPFVCSYDHMSISHMPICPYGPDRISHMPISHMPKTSAGYYTILTYYTYYIEYIYSIKGGHGLITLNPCWILTILTILTIHTYGNQSYAQPFSHRFLE